jgi:hypothetical protein
MAQTVIPPIAAWEFVPLTCSPPSLRLLEDDEVVGLLERAAAAAIGMN